MKSIAIGTRPAQWYKRHIQPPEGGTDLDREITPSIGLVLTKSARKTPNRAVRVVRDQLETMIYSDADSPTSTTSWERSGGRRRR